MNARQWRTAHGSNCVSATHAATRRYAYAKIQYVQYNKQYNTIHTLRILEPWWQPAPWHTCRDAALFPNYFGQTCYSLLR